MSHNDIDRATYSVEDNKLRLYPVRRLDAELYQRVKDLGFKWAPKQELFVAPAWSPEREDFCVELAEDILPEETTLIERADAKSERLAQLAEKSEAKASAFSAAAHRISARFEAGQPILVGHHSERKARNDKAQMERHMEKAVKAFDAIDYWHDRASGVERHANRKADPGVRARRIKTLLAEMRDHQRRLNHAHKCLGFWEEMQGLEAGVEKDKNTLFWVGVSGFSPMRTGPSLYSQLEDKQMTTEEAIDACIRFHRVQSENPKRYRWINHLLNRLAYERNELGEVPRFDGELTPVILQAFAREQGADKPKVTAENGGFVLESLAPLPLHIGEGRRLQLVDGDWRDLMQSVGYQVVIKERKKSSKQTVSLINPTEDDAKILQSIWNADASRSRPREPSECLLITQHCYSQRSGGDYSPYNTITLDQHGRRIWNPSTAQSKGQIPTCRVRVGPSRNLYSADRLIVLTDKPNKRLPFDLAALKAQSSAQTVEASA